MASNNIHSIARKLGAIGFAVLLLVCAVCGYMAYTTFRIDVPKSHIAVLMKRTGKDIDNDQVVAPDESHKGLQLKVLSEGRYFYNPWNWDWRVYPMVEIPSGKMGVRVRLYGDNLPYAHFLATTENEKGIIKEVLKPGRYPYNAIIKGEEAKRPLMDYVEIIELYDPITIPAGFCGVVTNQAGPLPTTNTLLVPEGTRGVQEKILEAGTYYLNPYLADVHLMDCRSQKLTMAENGNSMGFPSKDGFWVSLDGIIEFRVKEEKAAEVYVLYNEYNNDQGNKSEISNEIVKKIIIPNARSFCRLKGSDSIGRAFIGGETRTEFQKEFAIAMQKACEPSGIEIIQALITKINPPEAIAGPVRDREIAHQKLKQYKEQVLQQKAEAALAVQKETIKQKQELVEADQQVAQLVTTAKQEQQVAVTKASEKLVVAAKDYEAAIDQAAATLAGQKAEAELIDFQNLADAAGWKKSIEAFGNDGESFARYVLLQKIAPAYKQIMTNSADSPLMDIFQNFNKPNTIPATK